MDVLRGPFEPKFSELPEKIPLFPLSGALLLPGGKLPLNIFEPRYLAMIQNAFFSPFRLIGMIQVNKNNVSNKNKNLYEIGCAGRISNFSETEDGRMLITLSGVSRFNLLNYETLKDGYIEANVSWKNFDLDLNLDKSKIDREKLLENLKNYFKIKGFSVDWDHLIKSENEKLVTTLSMICPFDISEKQALLEAKDLSERSKLLSTILFMSTHDDKKNNAKH